jgi:hypothetical protein
LKKAILIVLSGLLLGCSTQKNTLVSRTYHNVTARYNFLFNAKESYNESIEKYTKEFPFAYSALLPVFLFSDKLATSKTAEGMERTILKSGMLIKYHSITAKPKNAKQETTSQRAFYNQREFCKYVDDAYLYITKANAYLHEYSKSHQTIDQILLNYPNSPTRVDAQIWQAAIAGAEGDLIQYANSLNTANQLRNISKPQKAFLKAAWADYYIRQGSYPKAIENLEQAVLLEGSKINRDRYRYILGQLYLQNNQRQQAAAAFHKVAKSTSSYEMAFNAQLDEARSYIAGSGSDLKNVLLKMAKSERNISYRDQIYYTIARIYQQDKNEKEALAYFAKSLSYSAPNSNQKGVTFTALADMAYSKKNFVQAQSYYDSATANLDNGHPMYNDALLRSKKLGRLALNTREYQRIDSLLKLSELGEADLNKIIDKKIALLTEQQNKAQEETNTQRQFMMNQNNLSLSTTQSGSWYFYNQSTLAFGAAEFKMRWGQRKLEDNWRRKNKGTLDQIAEEKKEEEKKKEEKTSPLTRDFYLKDIPKSAADKQKYIDQKQTALIEVADAYRADVDEPQQAIETLNGLMAEKLSEINEFRAYSIYYQSYLAINDMAGAQRYKELIANKYPKSELAKSFSSSALSLGEQSSAANEAFAKCVELLNASKYNECLTLANQQLKENANALTPQFALVKAMATGGLQGKEAYRKELAAVVSQYPNSEAAKTASEYLLQLDRQTLNLINSTEPTEKADAPAKSASITSYAPSDACHNAIIVVPKKTNFNQLKFNLVSLNLDISPEQELSINKQELDSNNDIIAISPFDTKKKAMDYYYALIQKQTIISQSGAETFAIFVISCDNLNLLLKDKTLESYADFFFNSYLK